MEEETDFYYELTDEEIQRLKKSEEQIKAGKTISHEELFNQLRSRCKLDGQKKPLMV